MREDYEDFPSAKHDFPRRGNAVEETGPEGQPIPMEQERMSQVISELAKLQEELLRRLMPVRTPREGLTVASSVAADKPRSELAYIISSQRDQLRDQLVQWRALLEDLEI